jgi:hypothetical protein
MSEFTVVIISLIWAIGKVEKLNLNWLTVKGKPYPIAEIFNVATKVLSLIIECFLSISVFLFLRNFSFKSCRTNFFFPHLHLILKRYWTTWIWCYADRLCTCHHTWESKLLCSSIDLHVEFKDVLTVIYRFNEHFMAYILLYYDELFFWKNDKPGLKCPPCKSRIW